MSPNNKNIIKEDNKTISARSAENEPAVAPIDGIDHRGEVDPAYIEKCRQRLHDQLNRAKQKQTSLAIGDSEWNE